MENNQINLGPFRTKEGMDLIMKFSKDKFFPALGKIEIIGIYVCDYKENFFELITKSKLRKIEKDFKSATKNFFSVYHEWNTPDLLFKDQKDNGLLMVDYFVSMPMLKDGFSNGFMIFDFVHKIISDKNTAYFNRMSFLLAILALVVSIISIII